MNTANEYEYEIENVVVLVWSPDYADNLCLTETDLAGAISAREIETNEFGEYVYKTQGGFITAKHALA